MPVVRCPTHDIPYNSANPRGCPACWREQQGVSSDAEVMKQLARLSMGLPAIEELPPPPPAPPPGQIAEVIPTKPPPGYRGPWPPPVTQQPKVPVPELTVVQKSVSWIHAHRATALGGVAILITLVLLWILARPDFIDDPQPPALTAEARPLAVAPNVPVEASFGMLGTSRPLVNPDARSLARYRWDDGIIVDGLNAMIYAVTLVDGSRSWNGLRVGAGEEPTRGALTLLGRLREPTPLAPRTPIRLSGYQVVNVLEDRPMRHVMAEIRPPNGCMDVQVTLVPRAIGRLRQSAGDLWVLARGAAPLEWVVGQVRVVSRLVPGPYAGAPDCGAAQRPEPQRP
ncbi:MAG: hypothetical protein WEC54_07190 [Gemmatimonadales bacterium]